MDNSITLGYYNALTISTVATVIRRWRGRGIKTEFARFIYCPSFPRCYSALPRLYSMFRRHYTTLPIPTRITRRGSLPAEHCLEDCPGETEQSRPVDEKVMAERTRFASIAYVN